MRVEINGKRLPLEEAFIRKAHDLLSENGKAIMLVPYTVLVSEQFQDFRTDFANYLQEVIALPSGSIGNTQIKTALLVFSKQASKEVKLTQLKQFENLYQEYDGAMHTLFSKEKLNERWDLEYHLTIESSFYKELNNFQTKELQELAEIIKGKMVPADNLKPKGDYLYIKPLHIKDNRLNLESSLKYVSNDDLTERDYKCILQPGDIVISTIFNELKLYVYQEGDVAAIASNNLAIIRSAKQDYILSYLQTDEGKRIFKTQAEDLKKGVTIPQLSIKDLAKIRIPILPIADLNALSNKAIERASESELLNQLETLTSIRPKVGNDFETPIAAEPAVAYGFNGLNQTELIMAFIDDRVKLIMNQIGITHKKLDQIIESFDELKNDFNAIRSLPRDEEERLFKLCQRIDLKLESIGSNNTITIENYVGEVKRWLDLWELLDPQSQKFLPIAEFIFDELSKFKDADYSPFVVQYCRTLENEILKKLFETYHSKGLLGVNRDELIKDDLENKKTQKFAQMIKRNKITYTLGDMNFIMTLLKHGGSNLTDSPLLQHFRSFTITYFDEKIVEADFLSDVNKLTNDFRNKAAHPYSINIELAKECQVLLRKSLNIFLESMKNEKQ
jgi:hypothetical protein